jgi:hypothetical protein
MNHGIAWRTLFRSVATSALASLVAACAGSNTAPGNDAGQCMPVVPPTTCPSPPPSYKNEIAAIVATHCLGSNCHSQGGAEGARDLATYQGLSADRPTVAFEVELCPSTSSGMPPPGYPQPTMAQRLDLVTWAGVCRAPNN